MVRGRAAVGHELPPPMSAERLADDGTLIESLR